MNIFDFDENLIQFKTTKILSGRLIWADLESLDKVQPQPNGKWTSCSFLDHFAYVIQGNQHFEEIVYAGNDIKDMYAEIYGGGLNGGSGRTGNLGQFQVKGVGQTMLVGKRADSWHSYGCFSLVEALLETVNSVVLNEVLPCGTAKCFGLILTGEQTAWPPNSDVAGRGALLIRESCLRPAHFFYNEKFSPKQKYKHLILNDKLRVKKITKRLPVLLGEPNGYEEFLKNFLNNYANQFSYAKIFRIYHGAINSSNVSLDGKWMDLTTASFIDSGKNYILSDNIPSFNAEHCTVLNFVEKLLEVYKMHNSASPKKEDLVKYYVDRFSWHLQNHVLELLGLDASISPDDLTKDGDFQVLVTRVWNLILSNDVPVKEIPDSLSDSDPLVNLLEGWFSALNKSDAGFSGYKDASTLSFIRFFNNQMGSSLSDGAKISATIKSLKKALFSEFFFKKRIEKFVTENVNNADISYLTQFIKSYKNVARWVFNDSQKNNLWIYQSSELHLSFDSLSYTFRASYDDKNLDFYSALEILKFIVLIDERYFMINGFSFKSSIVRIFKAMCDLKESDCYPLVEDTLLINQS